MAADQATKEWAMSKQGFTDEAATAFAEEYKLGEPMYLDDNYCECASYCVGDHRCECGNRRVSLSYEIGQNKVYYFSTEVS